MVKKLLSSPTPISNLEHTWLPQPPTIHTLWNPGASDFKIAPESFHSSLPPISTGPRYHHLFPGFLHQTPHLEGSILVPFICDSFKHDPITHLLCSKVIQVFLTPSQSVTIVFPGYLFRTIPPSKLLILLSWFSPWCLSRSNTLAPLWFTSCLLKWKI